MNYTPRKRLRKEPKSESEEESSEEERVTTRRSLPSVVSHKKCEDIRFQNYSQTTPRKRLTKKSESDESSKGETRPSGSNSRGNFYKVSSFVLNLIPHFRLGRRRKTLLDRGIFRRHPNRRAIGLRRSVLKKTRKKNRRQLVGIQKL